MTTEVDKTKGFGRPRKYPWLELKLGETFVLEAAHLQSAKAQVSLANARYEGRRFAVTALTTTTFKVTRVDPSLKGRMLLPPKVTVKRKEY